MLFRSDVAFTVGALVRVDEVFVDGLPEGDDETISASIVEGALLGDVVTDGVNDVGGISDGCMVNVGSSGGGTVDVAFTVGALVRVNEVFDDGLPDGDDETISASVVEGALLGDIVTDGVNDVDGISDGCMVNVGNSVGGDNGDPLELLVILG